jgi:hypothetical protein
MPRRPLAPCRCGHPGAGCSCYEERAAEAGWRTPGATRGWIRQRVEPVTAGGCGTNPFMPMGVTTRAEIRRALGVEADEVERNTCRTCGETIKVMVFRGTGYCSPRCQDHH